MFLARIRRPLSRLRHQYSILHHAQLLPYLLVHQGEALSASASPGLPLLERRSRNGTDEIDRPSQRWLAQEKRM
jgi:hypothetical protein